MVIAILAANIKIDSTLLSDATQGNYYYHYTSQAVYNYHSYGLMVHFEGNGGAKDGGYYANAFEAGGNPNYCMSKYTGDSANWISYNSVCVGGNLYSN